MLNSVFLSSLVFFNLATCTSYIIMLIIVIESKEK